MTLTLTILGLVAAAPAPGGEVGVEPALHLPVHSRLLPNGLMVMVLEDHRAPVVSTALLYRSGAAEDQPGLTGKAHLLEHLMFEGTPEVPSGQFDALLADVGAWNNAWTDHDWTVYQVQGPPQALELALWLEADRMRGALEGLQPEHLQNQRDVVLNERLQDEITDEVHPLYALAFALWGPAHPYAWPILGTREDLGALGSTEAGAEELRRFTQAVLLPNNAALVVVGDVDAQATLALAEQHFGPLSPGEPLPRVAGQLPARTVEERVHFVEDLDKPSLYAAWTTVPRGHADEPALDVLALILSGGRGTRLDEPLLYRRSRALAVEAATWNGRLGGQLVVRVVRDDRPLAPVLRRLDRELGRLQREGPTPAELERAVAQYRAATLLALEDHALLADTLHDCQETFGTPDCLGLDLARYAALTPADVQRAAQLHLGPGRVLLSVTSADERRLALPGSVEVAAP